ncbi:hypothetical protein [Streptomyces sp. NPDC091259]|uniref:hypothetical protein n=1 Tax=Streptomyces sp. NPDC091259 TaxID=3365976 RepID=UPI0037F5BD86
MEAASWSERYAYDEAGNQTAAAWPEQLGTEVNGERAYTGTRIGDYINIDYINIDYVKVGW